VKGEEADNAFHHNTMEKTVMVLVWIKKPAMKSLALVCFIL